MLRTVGLFLPLFLSAAGYAAFRLYFEDYENAVWAGAATAGAYASIAYFKGWNFSSASAATFTFIVVGYYDLDATAETLGLWTVCALVIAHTGVVRARSQIIDDRVVKDENIGFAERYFFEFFIYAVFLAAAFVAIKMPYYYLYGAGAILVIGFLAALLIAFLSRGGGTLSSKEDLQRRGKR